VDNSLAYDLESLAVDVFEITASGLTVESLTGGHAMTEVAASICTTRLCSSSCCCAAGSVPSS
jgi:hypothetical protein